METDVLLCYKRDANVWICAECETENADAEQTCIFCGRERVEKREEVMRFDPPPKPPEDRIFKEIPYPTKEEWEPVEESPWPKVLFAVLMVTIVLIIVWLTVGRM